MEWYSIDMTDDVKSERRPTLRDERAAVTRRRILEAARRLFADLGYGATTLVTVAEEAQVAVQTVYAVFGSKAGILRALREEVVRLPEAEALYAAALEAPDAGRALALFAGSISSRWRSGADIVRIHADAAASDTSLRREVEAVLARRRDGIASLVRSMAPAIRADLGADGAIAIVDALTLPEVYAALVRGGGWSDDAYERWLAAALADQLLGAP
jgi:AcrR family transcriptional regulator